jgi:uncharacterized protein (TIGR03083 family)
MRERGVVTVFVKAGEQLTGDIRPSTLVLRSNGSCDLDPERLIEVFGEQRYRFITILQGFGSDDWAAPTRCGEWSAHDVVRHLCDGTRAIAGDVGDQMFDLTAGFDPRVTPRRWLAPSDGEPPAATLRRFVAETEELLAQARQRLARGHSFDVRLPCGSADWTVMTLHSFWDSWIHERDVLLARGDEHPTGGDAVAYATAYGLFLAAVVASLFGDEVCQRLALGDDGGGIFDVDNRGPVTLTVTRVVTAGQPAAQVADALAGRAPAAAVLGDLPASMRAGLTRLADFFNTPVGG